MPSQNDVKKKDFIPSLSKTQELRHFFKEVMHATFDKL